MDGWDGVLGESKQLTSARGLKHMDLRKTQKLALNLYLTQLETTLQVRVCNHMWSMTGHLLFQYIGLKIWAA